MASGESVCAGLGSSTMMSSFLNIFEILRTAGLALQATVLYKFLARGQQFANQFWRRSLSVKPQQRFGPGRAEQHPGPRSIPVGRRIEEKLDPVEILFL